MRIGEIVEILIQIRDDYSLSSNEDEAVCAACNILSKLPRTENELELQERMKTV
ncbi:MAG: hypothetical protein HFE57_14160 [Firmicutes bacterium]|jgi:hypothetical protein|nr:hypothetical protein [Bacillota bacterium]